MLYAITTKVTRFRAREARVSLSEFLSRRLRFDSSFAVYTYHSSAPNAKNIKAGQFDREMSF